MPRRRAASTLGVTSSTTLRTYPPGTWPPACASSVAFTAPQASCPRTTTSGTSSTVDAELERAEDAGVDDVARGADDEEVAEAAVEHELRGDAGVRAAEDEGERPLAGGRQAGAAVRVGVRVLAAALDEPAVAGGEGGPRFCGGDRSVVHGSMIPVPDGVRVSARL